MKRDHLIWGRFTARIRYSRISIEADEKLVN